MCIYTHKITRTYTHTHERVGRPEGVLSRPTTIAEPKRRKNDLLFLPGKSVGNERLSQLSQ